MQQVTTHGSYAFGSCCTSRVLGRQCDGHPESAYHAGFCNCYWVVDAGMSNKGAVSNRDTAQLNILSSQIQQASYITGAGQHTSSSLSASGHRAPARAAPDCKLWAALLTAATPEADLEPDSSCCSCTW